MPSNSLSVYQNSYSHNQEERIDHPIQIEYDNSIITDYPNIDAAPRYGGSNNNNNNSNNNSTYNTRDNESDDDGKKSYAKTISTSLWQDITHTLRYSKENSIGNNNNNSDSSSSSSISSISKMRKELLVQCSIMLLFNEVLLDFSVSLRHNFDFNVDPFTGQVGRAGNKSQSIKSNQSINSMYS